MGDKISVIIPVRNEERYIDGCIESVLSFDYPKELTEVIFVDGMSTDKTVEIINSYSQKHPYIRYIENKEKIVPVAMNLGIAAATGDYICRLDGHSAYPADYLTRLLKWSKELDADNVGAVCVTGSKKDDLTARAIRFVMSDKFGVGNSLFRTGVDKVTESDTVPFGFYKKEVFEKIGVYNEKLVRVQDLELNKRLKSVGGKIFLVPDVKCTYYPRETFRSFFKNRYETGKWVILCILYTKKMQSVSLRNLIPFFFMLSLVLSFVAGFANKSFFWLFGGILALYSGILYLRALAMIKKPLFCAYVLAAYAVLHISYGLGSFRGFLKVIAGKIRHE